MGHIRKFTFDEGKFFVCVDHKIVLDTPNCPLDPCINKQSPFMDNCCIAGSYDTRTEAERWICKYEASVIEAQMEEEAA